MRLTASPKADQVAAALRALSRDMMDPYLLDDAVLARALACGAAAAVLAETGATPVGVALYTAFPSTTRGRMGVFVTDLWVEAGQRGTGLGRRMLARVLCATRWPPAGAAASCG